MTSFDIETIIEKVEANDSARFFAWIFGDATSPLVRVAEDGVKGVLQHAANVFNDVAAGVDIDIERWDDLCCAGENIKSNPVEEIEAADWLGTAISLVSMKGGDSEGVTYLSIAIALYIKAKKAVDFQQAKAEALAEMGTKMIRIMTTSRVWTL